MQNHLGGVALLYATPWKHELDRYRDGQVPSHRLFGFAELEGLGYQVELWATPGWIKRFLPSAALWRLLQALWVTLRQRHYSCILATTELPALPVLVLKTLRLIRRPVIVVSVALLHEKNSTGLRHALWARCLHQADVIIVYATEQAQPLCEAFGVPAETVRFVPFGVDTNYFSAEPVEAEPERDGTFVLSVGTNEGKDFTTLLRAMPPNVPLRIVTDDHNAGIIATSRRPDASLTIERAVPIERLRQLYRYASVHVIPLHEAPFSSGQTVLLENMALGKAVIVSDVSAVRDYVEPDVTAIVVPPGDPASLRRAIDTLLEAPAARERLGLAASASVRDRYSISHFAAQLAEIIATVQRDSDRLRYRRAAPPHPT